MMGKKCCVYNCKTNYNSQKKSHVTQDGENVSVFRFPKKETEPENLQRWFEIVSKVNANLKVGPETVICEAHWPKDYPRYKKKGRWRPSVPPSLFPNIPPSIVPRLPPKLRETTRS